MIADVGLHLLELRQHVAIKSLIRDSREEAFSHREQFAAHWRCVLNQRRVQALEDVWVGLERERHELLQFPVALLGRLVFQLLRDAKERPMLLGGREINATQIGV